MKKRWFCSLVLPGLVLAALSARQAAAQITTQSCFQQRQQLELQIRSLELRRATEAAECAKADELGLQSCNEMKSRTAQEIERLRNQESALVNCMEPPAPRNSQGSNSCNPVAYKDKDKDGDNENYDKNPKDQGKPAPPATDANKSNKHPKNDLPGQGAGLKDLQTPSGPSIKSQSQLPQPASHMSLDTHTSSNGSALSGSGVSSGGSVHSGGSPSGASSFGGASHSSGNTSSSGASRPK